jgi:hypothetical protein
VELVLEEVEAALEGASQAAEVEASAASTQETQMTFSSMLVLCYIKTALTI